MKRFFCQHCGEEVPLEVDICPKCHKRFGSVLCPKCNYSGSSHKFYNGCPKCGYLSKNITSDKNRLTLKIFLSLFLLLSITIILLIAFF